MYRIFFFFFSSRRRHTRLTCDWSSDVCSSDLRPAKLDADVREKMAALASSDPVARASAACALGRMQRRAVAAIPRLVALMSDGTAINPEQSCGQQEPFEDEQWQPRYPEVYEPSPGEAATQALMAIGEPALRALKDAMLLSEDWRVRKN